MEVPIESKLDITSTLKKYPYPTECDRKTITAVFEKLNKEEADEITRIQKLYSQKRAEALGSDPKIFILSFVKDTWGEKNILHTPDQIKLRSFMELYHLKEKTCGIIRNLQLYQINYKYIHEFKEEWEAWEPIHIDVDELDNLRGTV